MNAPAVQSTIDSLKGVYAIVLALAIGEAFKQFVVDRANKPEERHVQFDRLPALLSFLLLVIPFYHGIVRYYFDTYSVPPLPHRYGMWLSIDSFAFMMEAILFFVLSRSLSLVQWDSFYRTVILLCGFDMLWVLVGAFHNPKTIWNWVLLDIVTIVAIFLIHGHWRNFDRNPKKWVCLPALLPVLVLFARGLIDYTVNRPFYFPPNNPPATSESPRKGNDLAKPPRGRTVYLAGPLFTQAQWLWNQKLAEELRKSKFDVILPQESAEPMLKGQKTFDPHELFALNKTGIDKADFLLAVLDEADADSGTSWECGYAYRAGRPVIGLRTDIRTSGDDPNAGVNLMLSQGCEKLIRVPLDRVNDLRWVVQEVSEASGKLSR